MSSKKVLDRAVNPKDALAASKVDLTLFPPAALVYGAAAMRNGAEKYGPYNWRSMAIQKEVYIAAALRHLCQYLDGEECASDSGVPHLAHALATIAILIDAKENNCLVYGARPTNDAVVTRLIEEKFLKPSKSEDDSNE